jgi:hypothetical protein
LTSQIANPKCRECGLSIGLLLGKPPSSDDVTLCQDCFFTGSRQQPEQSPHLSEPKEDNFLLTLLLFYPKFMWLYSGIVIAFFTLPFMERDYEDWSYREWGKAILIFVAEIAAINLLLWIIGLLPDSSDPDPYWY